MVMNIAFLIPSLTGGGAERIAAVLGDYYYAKGHRIYYFAANKKVKPAYPIKGEIVYFNVQRSIKDDDKLLSIVAKLAFESMAIRKLKLKYKINVAISFMEYFNYLNILSKGIEKVIVSIHTVISERKDITSPLLQSQVVSFFYNLAPTIVVPGNYIKQDLHRNFNVHRKVYTIYNPSIRQNNQPDMEKWIYGDETIVCVGRLERVKQQERIIRAFSVVHRQNNKARLLILGEGPNEKYLKGICRESGLEEFVFFLRFKKNIGYYLQNSKLFVMSSMAEGFPVSMVEAMAYGVPVISTDSPGGCGEILGKKIADAKVAEIQYAEYGVITPYISGKLRRNSDLEEQEIMLGNAMNELLGNPHLYQKYHKKSLKRASMYSIERIMRRWDRLIFD